MFRVTFRHRPDAAKIIERRHSEVMDGLCAVGFLWPNGIGPDVRVSCSGGEGGSADLTPFMPDGVKGAISYVSRVGLSSMEDRAMFDDFLTLDLDESKIDYGAFALRHFGEIARRFSAYRAESMDIDLGLADYSEICAQSQATQRDVDGRDSIFRINALNYFDRELCYREFKQTPTQIASKLRDHVELVEATEDALLLVVTSEFLDVEQLKAVNAAVRNYLAGR